MNSTTMTVRREILVHAPSLVQQLPIPSSLGCDAHRAIDYDPFFRA